MIVKILELVYDSIILVRNAIPYIPSSDSKSIKDILDLQIIDKYIDQVFLSFITYTVHIQYTRNGVL